MNFIEWIGIVKPNVVTKTEFTKIIVAALLLLLIPGIYLILSFNDKSMIATSRFAGTGVIGFISALIFAFIQTGLAEEILFRGFLNKRISNKFGFTIGNSVQAALFGLLHGVLLFTRVSPFIAAGVIIFTFAAGWIMGYINEKLAGGSIIPSWAVHGIVNLISASVFILGIIKP